MILSSIADGSLQQNRYRSFCFKCQYPHLSFIISVTSFDFMDEFTHLCIVDPFISHSGLVRFQYRGCLSWS